MKDTGVEHMYVSTVSLTSVPDGGGWLTPRPGYFTLGKKIKVRIVQEDGWVRRPVETGEENVALTGIRYPDRPARSQSLYCLHYHGPHIVIR